MREEWRKGCWLVCMLLLAGWLRAEAPVLHAEPGAAVVPLAGVMQYWRDAGGGAGLEQARQQHYDAVPSGGNLGFDGAVHWFRFRLQNLAGEDQSWVFKAEFPVTDHLALYSPDAQGRYHEAVTGDGEPWSARPWRLHDMALPLVVPAHTAQDYYLRMETSSSAILSAKLYDPEYFWTSLSRQQLFAGLFYGAMLVLVLYNLFLFFTTTERVYLFYALTLIPMNGYLLCMDGLFYALVRVPGVLQDVMLPACIGITCIFSLLFVGHYLGLSARNRWWRMNRLLAAGMLLLLLVLAVAGAMIGTQLILAYGVLVCCYLLVLGLVAFRFKPLMAFYFVMGWSAFWATQVGAALAAFGLLPFLDSFLVGIKLSAVWTVLWLSLGLGKRLLLMRDAEQRSEQAVLLAQAESRAKGDFLAVMSHEIRTPLNGIMGMAELLRATGLSSEQSRIMATMEASGHALTDVINDILDYSKIEAGKMALESARFDLDHLLDECLALFKPRIYKQQLGLVCSIACHVPTELAGDAVRLRQILVNLLSNAVKFTSRGRIELLVDTELEADGQVRLRLTVSDTGIGIEPDRLERIFDSFSQAESSTTRQFGGTGLGLSISRQLAFLMDGDIHVESEVGRGSRFMAEVMLACVDEPRERDRLPFEFSRVRVLLVDADPRFCEIMQREASLPLLQVSAVQTGQEAITALKEAHAAFEPFQWLVTALQLRDMNGLSLHDRVRNEPGLEDVRTLLFALPQLQPSPGVLVHAGVARAFERPVRAQELRDALFDAMRADQPLLEVIEPEPSYPQHPSLKVLVAEDNRTNQLVIQGLLRKFGIQPVMVDNGRQAVTVFASSDYDLVLMDCEMPVLDGYAAAREMRTIEAASGRHRVPILAISAHVTQHYIDNCYAAGMDDHISKPVSSRALAEKLERWAL